MSSLVRPITLLFLNPSFFYPHSLSSSTFAVHNETFNIISHGVGTFFFASILAKRVLRYLRTGFSSLFVLSLPPSSLPSPFFYCFFFFFFFFESLSSRPLGKGMKYEPPIDQSLLLSLHPISYIFCFGISAIAHTFCAHSKVYLFLSFLFPFLITLFVSFTELTYKQTNHPHDYSRKQMISCSKWTEG